MNPSFVYYSQRPSDKSRSAIGQHFFGRRSPICSCTSAPHAFPHLSIGGFLAIFFLYEPRHLCRHQYTSWSCWLLLLSSHFILGALGLLCSLFFMHFGLIFEYHSHRHIDSNFLGKCVWFWRYVFCCIHSYKNICACIYKEGEKGRECEGWVRVVVCVWREPQEISGYGNVGDVIYRFCRFCPIFVPAVAISFPQKMTFAEADILRCVWRLPS